VGGSSKRDFAETEDILEQRSSRRCLVETALRFCAKRVRIELVDVGRCKALCRAAFDLTAELTLSRQAEEGGAPNELQPFSLGTRDLGESL